MRLLGFKMPARVASRSGTSTKGRGGRKGGASRSSSGPERRRVLRPQNYKQTPAIKAWREPVPQPLPPAPLLGLPTLALLGVQALAHVWGLFNNPKPTVSVDWHGPEDPDALPWSVIQGTGNGVGNMTASFEHNTVFDFDEILVPNNATVSTWYSLVAPIPGVGVSVRYNYRFVDRDGVVQTKQVSVQGSPANIIFYTNDGPGVRVVNWRIIQGSQTTPVAEIFFEDLEPVVIGTPAATAPIQLQPAVDPRSGLPAPIRTPYFEPPPNIQTAPGVLPSVVPTSPGPVAPAVVKPALPPTVAPIRVPTTTPTKDGDLVAPAPAPVPATPQDAIFPVPGGLPVSGQTVRRTVQGIAQEVGRIEQKIDKMVNPTPGQWGDRDDRSRILEEIARRILDAILSLTGGTEYTLDSPCEVDEVTGEKLPPVVVEAPGGFSVFGSILNRIDAVAELIQVHKDLKQPNCKPKQPVGEFVTVNFEEID